MAEAGEERIPERELVMLLAYLETGSHEAAALRLGITESTRRRRMGRLLERTRTADSHRA